MTRWPLVWCVVAAIALAIPLPVVGQRGEPARAAAPPRLLVLLVVDQFRSDYVDWYGSQWTGGLHRLMTTGAVFRRGSVPYGITKTCAGHASISTGTMPAAHGLIDNEWYDRDRDAIVGCTADETAQPVALAGGVARERHSAARLRVPTLAEELRRQSASAPRVISIALKARSAIALAGRGGDGTIVFWEEDSGTWATSSAYASGPWPEASSFLAGRPALAARGQRWDRLLPAARYLHTDLAPGEPPGGAFPHALVAPPGVPFAVIWDMSPWADAYLAEMAGGLVERTSLGTREATDLLAVGFSALDYVGHQYGPRSHEVQDQLVRLDLVLGRLFETLDRAVGPDRYVVALTSDHGVADLPEQTERFSGATGGRVSLDALARAIEASLAATIGTRRAILTVTSSYVHFLPGVLEELRSNRAAQQAVVAAAQSVRGIERVFWSWDLASPAPTSDERLAAMRRSYVAGRSGDLAFQPQPHWVVASAGTNHGSWHDYDTAVPIVFMGGSIATGQHATPASIVDVAPTLASWAGVTMPRATGRVLPQGARR